MNCCNCICSRQRNMRGPTGATGPTGPTGPTGRVDIASFYQSGEEVGSNMPINFGQLANFSNGNINHIENSPSIMLVETGYYRISYNTTATINSQSTDATTISIAIKSNGEIVPQSETSSLVANNNFVNIASSFIFNSTSQNAVLNLTNISNTNVIFNDTNLTIEFLGD